MCVHVWACSLTSVCVCACKRGHLCTHVQHGVSAASVASAARQAYLLTPEKTPAEEVVAFFRAGLSIVSAVSESASASASVPASVSAMTSVPQRRVVSSVDRVSSVSISFGELAEFDYCHHQHHHHHQRDCHHHCHRHEEVVWRVAVEQDREGRRPVRDGTAMVGGKGEVLVRVCVFVAWRARARAGVRARRAHACVCISRFVLMCQQ